MRAETERQARAGQGPDQQRQAVKLREGPGSSGAGLRLVFSRKQKFMLQNKPGKRRLPTSKRQKSSCVNDELTRDKQTDAPRKRKHRNRKSQKLVERDKNGPSNHMRSSQSTRHMFYLKSLEGPIVVEAAIVQSSKLKGGKVRVSIRRAIFEPRDQTFFIKHG